MYTGHAFILSLFLSLLFSFILHVRIIVKLFYVSPRESGDGEYCIQIKLIVRILSLDCAMFAKVFVICISIITFREYILAEVVHS